MIGKHFLNPNINMKKDCFNLLLSIQNPIPFIGGFKFGEDDRTIDAILSNLSLLEDPMFLVGIGIGVSLSFLIWYVIKHAAGLILLRKQVANIVAHRFSEKTKRKLKQVWEKVRAMNDSIISIVLSLHGLRDLCFIRKILPLSNHRIYGYGHGRKFIYQIIISRDSQGSHEMSTGMEIPTNRQISCLGEDALVNEEEFQPQKTDDKSCVLLVMSDKILSNSLKLSLSEYFECSVLEDSDTLLKVSALNPPKAIILDETVNGVLGDEICSRIKSDKATAGIPVIILVRAENDERYLSYLTSGADRLEARNINVELLKIDICMLIKNQSVMKKRARQFINRSVTATLPLLANTDGETKIFLNVVHKLLEEHLMDDKYTVKKLCEAMGMSRTTFYTKMLDVTGYSPKRYILLYKIDKAKALLGTGEYRISDIAIMLGFYDSKYFSKQFKKVCGVCPSEYISNVIDGSLE